MSESVQVALIVGFFGFMGSIALAVITGWLRSKDKQEDWDRQDEVAARVANAELRAEATAVAAGEAAAVTNSKLETLAEGQKEIHTLVNSNMTAAMQGEYDSTVLLLAALEENISDKIAQGKEPSTATIIAIGLAKKKLAELEATLRDRNSQQNIVDDEKASAAAEGVVT